jgi:ATP-dependent helicase HepA
MRVGGEGLAIGAFVVLSTPLERKLGIGKLVRISGERCVVAYFDVPGETRPFQVDVPITDVRVVALSEQTRVFRCDEVTGQWQVGRIIDGHEPNCLVAFPNRVTDDISRADLQVRWRRPIANPMDFLIRQVTETPFFAEARSKFMRIVTQQHAACRGMSALLSSVIDLEDYQFNVVTRVLQDPIQRYLLADEVGLGKTVEAGLIIRQYTLDAEDARVVVIAPPSLVAQWREELGHRFGLLDRLGRSVWVMPSDRLNEARKLLEGAGMLVIDEAHNLSRISSEGANPLYEMLRPYAAGVQRLLLLSGTPVLADTSAFLRILHLLDPVVFPLNDLDGFERRIKSRQLVAEIVASLTPGNVLAMEADLDVLRETFGDDPTLIDRVEALRPIVRALPEADSVEFLSALNDLRGHLSETYKLHRRILRNRRKAVPWATPQRSGLQVLPYASLWRAERQLLLDELRVHLINSEGAGDVVRSLFSCAVHAYGGVSVEEALLSSGSCETSAIDVARRIDELTERAHNEGERQRVTRDAVRKCLTTESVQVVVFCDETTTADELYAALRADFRGITEVVRHSIVNDLWCKFLTDPSRCRVLVCDARAEEGLNLHGGHKVAVHYDIPQAPNRVEQRLGRLDRYGSGVAVQSLVPVCESDPNEVAWVSCLDEGLQVFSSSISSLQYVVEATLRNAIQDWCNEGVGGLQRWKDQLSGPSGWAALERRRIDQQDVLDAMGDPGSRGFDKLDAADREWKAWRDAVIGFANNALQFNLRSEDWNGTLAKGERVFRLNYAPDKGHQTLLSLSEIRDHFGNAFDRSSRHASTSSPLTHPYAFDRRTVMSKEGRARGLRMLRCGDPFVDSLRSFCETDDRGRVFAMWRYLPNYEARDASGCDLWFRFDYLVQANLPDANDTSARALTRRVEQHFPRQFYTVWIEATREVTMAPPSHLSAAYRSHGSGRDYNLNAQRWDLLRLEDRVPWLLEWHRHCELEAGKALRFISAHDSLGRNQAKALGSLGRQHTTRIAQIASRLTRLTGAALVEERRMLDEEKELHNRLVEAIRSPEIRADSVGAVFMSARTPFLR